MEALFNIMALRRSTNIEGTVQKEKTNGSRTHAVQAHTLTSGLHALRICFPSNRRVPRSWTCAVKMGLLVHAWEKEAKASGKQPCLPFPGLLPIPENPHSGPLSLDYFISTTECLFVLDSFISKPLSERWGFYYRHDCFLLIERLRFMNESKPPIITE